MIRSPLKSNAEDLAIPSQEHALKRMAEGWNRFWFNPIDPTTLGLVRICVGLLALYVHLVYIFDLQQLFGKDAWFNLATINDFRQNEPVYELPSDWGEESRWTPPTTPEEQQYRLK